MNICADYTWPSVAMGVEVFRKGLYELKARNVRSRYITDITKDNIEYCKDLMQISELRHLNGIKGNFALSEKAYPCILATNQHSGADLDTKLGLVFSHPATQN